jgi:hypothetical protein
MLHRLLQFEVKERNRSVKKGRQWAKRIMDQRSNTGTISPWQNAHMKRKWRLEKYLPVATPINRSGR